MEKRTFQKPNFGSNCGRCDIRIFNRDCLVAEYKNTFGYSTRRSGKLTIFLDEYTNVYFLRDEWSNIRSHGSDLHGEISE